MFRVNDKHQKITVHIHPSSGRGLLTAGAAVVSEQPALTELLVGHQNVSQQAVPEPWQSVGYHVAGLVRPVPKVSAAGEQRGRQEQKPVQGRWGVNQIMMCSWGECPSAVGAQVSSLVLKLCP